MFTLMLKIRQAEVALADGRLDEAYELARRDDVRAHARGQKLLGKLVRSLAARGQAHVKAGRGREAAADAEKAAALGGNLPEVVELKSKSAELLAGAAEAVMKEQRDQRQKARVLEAARQRIEQGELSAGRQLLTAVADDESRADWLLKDVEAREAAIRSAADAAAAALKRDDWEAALGALSHLRPADLHDKLAADVAARVTHRVAEQARDALGSGHLHLAEAVLDRLAHAGLQPVEAKELRQALAQCRRAWRLVDEGRPRQAEETLRRVAALLPKASWVTPAVRQLKQAAEALEELRAGPLGLLGAGTDTVAYAPAPTGTPVGSALADRASPNAGRVRSAKADPTGGDELPARFILQVDGAGSYCVLTAPLVTVGPVSSPHVPDLGLIAEAGAAVAKLERSEDDYFLRAESGPVVVNGQVCTGGARLLKNGDEIALSPRCRFRFRLPNVASTSALLDLTGSRLPRADVRRVVLLDRELVVGPGPLTHVRVDDLTEPLVLHVHRGRLMCRTKEHVLVEGRQVDPKAPLPVGAHVRVGPVSFVVTKA